MHLGSAVPAYGRTYKTAKSVKEDWEEGKDFLLQSFNGEGYLNKHDCQPGDTINIRFADARKVCVVKA